MTIEELTSALESLLEAVKADGRSEEELTDEEAERCADLTAQINARRKRQALVGEARSLLTPVRSDLHVHLNTRTEVDVHERAFEAYLRSGQENSDLAEFRAQSVGTNTAGGYLVPSGFRAKLIERTKAFGGIAEVAETMTTSEGNPISYPVMDDTANVGEIVAEGGTFAAGADLVFGTRALSAYKYMSGGAGNLPLKVSWELRDDTAFDLPGKLSDWLGTRIGRLQAVHWATGTGTGQPQGLVTPFTTIGAIASNATGPTYAELLGTVNALDPSYWSGARWVMNSGTMAKIQGQLDTTGRPILNDANRGISGDPGGQTLLGYPVTIDQAMPNMATGAKFLVFGNIAEAYVIRRVKDVTLVVLNELYAANGQTGYMAWARADGAVQNMNAAVVRTAAA